jgi:hypothetical protein
LDQRRSLPMPKDYFPAIKNERDEVEERATVGGDPTRTSDGRQTWPRPLIDPCRVIRSTWAAA